MKSLRTRGGVAAAIVAAAAMVLSTIAIAPAYAADTENYCVAVDEQSFNTCITGDKTILVNQAIKFNSGENKSLFSLGLASFDSYGKPIAYRLGGSLNGKTISKSVTIEGRGAEAILHNVTFTIPSDTSLTLKGSIVLDDVNLSGLNLLGVITATGLLNPPGIPSAIDVAGGVLNLNDTACVASGADGAVKQQKAIDVTAAGSIVNLGSSGIYKRPNNIGLDIKVNIPLVGTLLNPILSLLNFERDSDYPTVWGRDAAVYSEPDITDATINISNGTYSNQKDKHTLTGGNYLNAAVSSSATVNIIGSNNVEISNTKIGNRIDSEYNGDNTTGTLNLVNPNARLDPATETSNNVQKQMTDSFALELRGTAKANIVAGSINDTLDRTKLFNKKVDPKVIESEVGTSVNILNSQYTDGSNGTKYKATIANRGYYIAPTTQKDDGSFTAWVNADASSSDPATSGDYQFWTGKVEASDDALTQLSNLVAAEYTGAAKLTASTYETGRLTAAYADSTDQAIYGKKIISSGTNKSPFQGVNDKGSGTVTLYGAPWTGTYTPGDSAPEQTGKLFAGWYTSKTAFDTEDGIQGTSLNSGSTGDKPKHHVWASGSETWNNTIVLNKSSYSGSLYPHFVDADTMGVTGVQVANATKAGTYDLRILSGVDSYNFKNFAFTIKYQKTDGSWATFAGSDRTTSKVAYDYVSVAGESKKQVYTDSPYQSADGYSDSVLGDRGDARYLTTVKVNKVPANTTFQVTPQWTTLDGTTVTGASTTFTLKADGKIYK